MDNNKGSGRYINYHQAAEIGRNLHKKPEATKARPTKMYGVWNK